MLYFLFQEILFKTILSLRFTRLD